MSFFKASEKYDLRLIPELIIYSKYVLSFLKGVNKNEKQNPFCFSNESPKWFLIHSNICIYISCFE